MFAFPVGVQLFNRPEYAEKVLTSLREQTLPVDQSRLFIYIDGFKGSIYESRGSVDKTREVEYLAKAIFPVATVLRFAENCGIADLHNRLQERAFAGNDPWAAFFEEDLILNERYLEELSDLIEIVDETDEVVKVACFQIISRLYHLPRGYEGFYPGCGTKAFAERRSFHLEKAPMLQYFVELQRRKDLPEVKATKKVFFIRDSQRLALLAGPKGIGTLQSFFNKDAAGDIFLQSRGYLHVVTKPAMAKDIGEEGIHHSVHTDLGFYSNAKSSRGQLKDRKSKFESEVKIIQSEMNDELISVYKNILDGYFISLSGRAMLKKITQRLVARFYSSISRNRQR
jgi:hypothetical protein